MNIISRLLHSGGTSSVESLSAKAADLLQVAMAAHQDAVEAGLAEHRLLSDVITDLKAKIEGHSVRRVDVLAKADVAQGRVDAIKVLVP